MFRAAGGAQKPQIDDFRPTPKLDITKPYEFIGFGAIDITKTYEFIGFGAMDVLKQMSATPRSILGGTTLFWGAPPFLRELPSPRPPAFFVGGRPKRHGPSRFPFFGQVSTMNICAS